MRNTKFFLSAAAILAAAASTPAFAQETESSITVSGNAAVVTDYRFRGVAQSNGNPAIQGGIDVGHDSGFYVGTWGSSVSGAGGTEIDVYGGWSGDVTDGVGVDVGVLYYYYPNAIGASDFFEPYASVSATLGPVEATVGAAYTIDGQSGAGNQDNIYAYTDLSAGIPDTPVTLNAHIGLQDGAFSSKGSKSTLDWSVGADYAITDKLTFGVAYTDTDAPAIKDATDSSVLATLSIEF